MLLLVCWYWGFQEGQEVYQNYKDTLILCFAHKNTHSARALQHGRRKGLFYGFYKYLGYEE
jgi:hypothetical protein